MFFWYLNIISKLKVGKSSKINKYFNRKVYNCCINLQLILKPTLRFHMLNKKEKFQVMKETSSKKEQEQQTIQTERF